jgi:hypothetical protein
MRDGGGGGRGKNGIRVTRENRRFSTIERLLLLVNDKTGSVVCFCLFVVVVGWRYCSSYSEYSVFLLF